MYTLLVLLTFLFGTLRLLTFTKLFTSFLETPFKAIFGITNKEKTVLGGLIVWLDNTFFYFSLIFQAYFWFHYLHIL
jgi:hypothetical protein